MTDTRYIIASIPKAGTYLAAAILKHMGVRDAGLHLHMTNHHTNYGAAASLEDARRFPKRHEIHCPIEHAIASVKPGEFACSHAGPILRGYIHSKTAIIFMRRNLRNCLVSYCRWRQRTQRYLESVPDWLSLSGAKMIEGCAPRHAISWARVAWLAAGWLTVDPTMTLGFEQLIGQEGAETQTQAFNALAGLTDWRGNIQEAIAATVGAETLTWSGQLTDWHEWWSPKVEMIFESLGVKLINDYMGYERAQGT